MVGTITSGLHLGSPIQRCCKNACSNTKDDFQLSRKTLTPMQADEAEYALGVILVLYRDNGSRTWNRLYHNGMYM